MNDPKLEAVRTCIGQELRRHAIRYAASLDESVLKNMLDNARSGKQANLQLNISVAGQKVASKADSAETILPVGKSAVVTSPFICDVYLAGSPGQWRSDAIQLMDSHVVCDPEKALKRTSGEGENSSTYEVPKGIDTRVILYLLEDGCDNPKIVGGLLTAVWFHGMSAIVVLGNSPQRDILLAVCQLAGAHVHGSLDEAVEQVGSMLRDGPIPSANTERVDFGDAPTGHADFGSGPVEQSETIIRLPSGNQITLKYFGSDQVSDRVMLHSRSDGAPGAPLNLDLIIPDPDKEVTDTVLSEGGQEFHPVEVHRVKVRHHGPTDPRMGMLPPGFLPPGFLPPEQR